MKSLITAILLLAIAHTQGIEPFPNPLGFTNTEGQTDAKSEVRDPCIIREGDAYYLVFTMQPFSNRDENRLTLPNLGSSPGIAIYSSKDLKSWTFSSWLVKSSDLPENSPYKKDPRGRLFLGGHAAIYDTPCGTRWFSYRNEVLGGPQHAKLCVDPFVIDKDGKVQTPAPAQQLKP